MGLERSHVVAQLLECHKCSHHWEYSGTLARETWPSCAAKVPVERQSSAESIEDIAADYHLTVPELKELLERVGSR